MARSKWTPETPWVKSNKKTAAYWPPYVCKNPSCRSFGRAHPNCRCRPPSFAQQSRNLEYDAEGGEVGRHFCQENDMHDFECEHFADGGEIRDNLEFINNPSLAVDHSIVSHGLLHALTRTGHSKSENAHKPAEDFMDHVQIGRKSLESHTHNHFDPKHEHPEIKKSEVVALKDHLDAIKQNPGQLMGVGSFPGLDAHSAALAAKAATASDYFDTLKPKQSMPGPMDPVMPPDKSADQNYRRQLGIAEHPLSILGKVRDGTVLPADLQTLNTLYPHLVKSIQAKTFESLVSAKTDGAKIPYRHKMGLSFLLGQPLDATMTPQAMQTIMKANAGAQTESQRMPGKKRGATAATQETIAKTDELYRTQLERIQAGK